MPAAAPEAAITNSGASIKSIRSLTATYTLFFLLLASPSFPLLFPPLFSALRYATQASLSAAASEDAPISAATKTSGRAVPPRGPGSRLICFATIGKPRPPERWPKLTTSRIDVMARFACRGRIQIGRGQPYPSVFAPLFCVGAYRIPLRRHPSSGRFS